MALYHYCVEATLVDSDRWTSSAITKIDGVLPLIESIDFDGCGYRGVIMNDVENRIGKVEEFVILSLTKVAD